MAKIGLTMRENVSLVVLGVDIFVKAGTVVDEGVFEVKTHLILRVLREKRLVYHLNLMMRKLNVPFCGLSSINLYV